MPHFINVFVSSEASVGECWDDGEQWVAGAPVAFAPFTEGCVTHSLNDVALSIGDGVDGAEVVVVEVAGFVRDGGCWRACCTRCVGFDVNGNQLSIDIDEVLVLGVGVWQDL